MQIKYIPIIILCIMAFSVWVFPAEHEDFIPADSFMVAKLDMLETINDIEELVSLFGYNETYQLINLAIEDNIGINFTQPESIPENAGISINDPIFAAITDINIAENATELCWVIILKITDSQAAIGFIQTLHKIIEEDEDSINQITEEQASYHGVEYTNVFIETEGYYSSYRKKLYSYGFVDDCLIAGNEMALRKAVDCYDFDDSILSSQDYNEIINFGENNNLNIYYNLYSIFGPFFSQVINIPAKGFSLGIDEDGLYFKMFSREDNQESTALNLNETGGLINYMPEGTVSYAAINYDLSLIINSIHAIFSEDSGDGLLQNDFILNLLFSGIFYVYSEFFYGIYYDDFYTSPDDIRYSEMDLAFNFLLNLTGEMGMYFYDLGDYLIVSEFAHNSNPEMLMYFNIADVIVGYELISKIELNLRANEINYEIREIENNYFIYLPSDSGFCPFNLYIGIIGNNLVLCANQELLSAVIENQANDTQTNWMDNEDEIIVNSINNGFITTDVDLSISPADMPRFLVSPIQIFIHIISNIRIYSYQSEGWSIYQMEILLSD